MSSSGEQIIVPRNFVLLEELEKAEKGNTDMSVSMGLTKADDVYMYDWQCTILGPYNTAIDGRIISLSVHCSDKYPLEMPSLKFQTKLNFPFLDDKGCLKASHKFQGSGADILNSWNRNNRIESLLVALKAQMSKAEHKKLPQPPEGATY